MGPVYSIRSGRDDPRGCYADSGESLAAWAGGIYRSCAGAECRLLAHNGRSAPAGSRSAFRRIADVRGSMSAHFQGSHGASPSGTPCAAVSAAPVASRNVRCVPMHRAPVSPSEGHARIGVSGLPDNPRPDSGAAIRCRPMRSGRVNLGRLSGGAAREPDRRGLF